MILAGDRGDPNQLLEALRSGAADFLPRDFRPEELESALLLASHRAAISTARLDVEENPGAVRQVPLHGKDFTIGRDPSNNLYLESVIVSRFHARISRQGTGHWIIDCASRHGTFVDDVRITTCPLRNGMRIRLGTPGGPTLTFQSGEEAPTDESHLRSSPPQAEASVDSSQELRDIASLVDTFLKLNGDLLVEDVLQIVVARSIELADADRGMILLLEPSARSSEDPTAHDSVGSPDTKLNPEAKDFELQLAIARRRDGTTIEQEGLTISRRIPLEVLRTGSGVILENLLASESRGYHPTTIEIGVRSAMCVPLRVRRNHESQGVTPILGVLYVDSSSRRRPFSARLLEALESLASEAAQAIYNSQLYEECLVKREFDAEMRIARSIQKDLLPPSGYHNSWLDLHGTSRPSREVGGDLLDYHAHGEERVHVLIGDVSGKGIPAAMMLDGLFYGMGAQVVADPDLGRAANALNRYLLSKSSDEKFVSAILGILWADGRFAYVNAGHNPPLCIRAGGEVEVLRPHGTILGMFEESRYSTVEIPLAKGDLLVLYSDGLTEARAKSGERFGFPRLQQAAVEASARSAREVHDAVLSAAARFTAGAPRSDDTTILVAKMLVDELRISSSSARDSRPPRPYGTW